MRLGIPLALAAVVLLGCRPSPHPSPEPPTPPLERVTRVLDGDTVDLGAERIRLKGINAPEKGECGADKATEALAALVAEGVRVDRRGTGDRGRTLGYLYGADGTAIHTALARPGLVLAYPYGDNDDQAAALAEAEQAARVEHLGLFDPHACGPTLAVSALIEISELVQNPPGDDLADGAGEYVAISGPAGTALSGWVIKDTSAGNRFSFPAGTVLPEGGALRIYTGCGAAAPDRLFWCRKGAGVWNNTGDTAFLLDPSGNLVDERATTR
mgnify:CR=1 FL=1